jgi:tetratricopeptide (TPR) repeat protein
MPVQLAAVEPDPGTTLLLYADTLRAEDAASVRKFASDVQAKAPKGQSLAVALVTGDGVSTLGPFKTAAQLNRALAEMTGAFARDTSSLTPARFYDSLPGALRTLYGDTEQNWPSLKVVANFPALSSDVEEFAAVVWSRVLSSRHVRATFWSPSGTIPTAFEQVNALTGGGEGPLQVGTYVESTPLKSGFVLGKAKLYVGDMEPVSVGWLSVASGFSLPSVETYAEFRKLRTAALAGESDASAALALNPRDAELLRLAANAFTGRKEWTRASESLEGLAELEPENGSLLAELGHVLFLTGRMDAAEARLQRAIALKSESPQVHEELARILHMSGRDAAAAFHFDAALKANGTQLLWFLAADSALKAGDWKRVADLTEGGLQLGGDVLDRRTRLVELLLSQAPADSTTQQRALRLVRAAASSLPSEHRFEADTRGSSSSWGNG